MNMEQKNLSFGEIEGDARTAILYAYRYLLNREPEDLRWIMSNTKMWPELRKELINSDEFLMMNGAFLAQDAYTTQKFLIEKFHNPESTPDYERILEQQYRKLIQEGDTVVDIGAHMGRHLTVFQKLAGNGRLFAFEPLPKQFKHLKENFCAPNITLQNCALFNKPGKSTFYELPDYPEESGLRLRVDKDEHVRQNMIDVEIHCLDEYEHELRDLNYIKLDAEGAEVPILEGAECVLRRYRPYVSTEYGGSSYGAYGLTAYSLFDFCEKIGYCITDLWGNTMLSRKMWGEIVNTCYWDYFLVPRERIREFSIAIHRLT